MQMTPIAWTVIAPVDAEELLAVHRAAISHGVDDTTLPRDLERTAAPIELLALVVERLPDLALGTFVAQTLGTQSWDCRLLAAVSQMRGHAAGAIRLCQRALEAHARDIGYDLRPWTARSMETAAALLFAAHRAQASHEDSPTPVAELRDAARRIGLAMCACDRDRMAVPEHLSEAVGRLVLLYMVAGQLEARHR